MVSLVEVRPEIKAADFRSQSSWDVTDAEDELRIIAAADQKLHHIGTCMLPSAVAAAWQLKLEVRLCLR